MSNATLEEQVVEDRKATRRLWLENRPDRFGKRVCPLPGPIEAWEIQRLLVEMSSGTQPCTSCCTQCSSQCCNATYAPNRLNLKVG